MEGKIYNSRPFIFYGRNSAPPQPPLPKEKTNLSAVLRGQSCKTNKEFLRLKGVIKLPKIDGKEYTKQMQFIRRHIASNEILLASNYLSDIVQDQISQIQGMDCNRPNLQCGHFDRCGIGCQMHLRIACLIMSYVTGLPLLHTVESDGWTMAYSGKWRDVFQPLGSSCKPGPKTIVWKWNGKPKSKKVIPYPLAYGIPLDARLGDILQTLHSDPFNWLMGQFTRYAMRLNTTFEAKMEEWKAQIGFSNKSSPIVGIQVRLTDKFTTSEDSHHPITLYMDEVETYFQNLESSQGLKTNSLKRRVFVASDNSSILAETIKMKPDWEIIGFESHFSESLTERRNGLFEIVRDIELLSQCDFVVCGFTSNVCRLIHERHGFVPFQSPRLKSLDIAYEFRLHPGYTLGFEKKNLKIWKIDC